MRNYTNIEGHIEEGLRIAWDICPDTALQLLNALLQKEPRHALLHHALGIIHFNCFNDLLKAEEHFRLAIQFDPTYTNAYWHLGKLLADNQRMDDACEIYRRGLYVKQQSSKSAYA